MKNPESLLVLMQVIASQNGVRSVDELQYINPSMTEEDLAGAIAQLVDDGYVEFIDDDWIGATVDGCEHLERLRLDGGLGILYQVYNHLDFPFSVGERPNGLLGDFRFKYEE